MRRAARAALAPRDGSTSQRAHRRRQIDSLKAILAGSRGTCATVLRLRIPQRSETALGLGESWNVSPSDEFLARIERLFGAHVATLS